MAAAQAAAALAVVGFLAVLVAHGGVRAQPANDTSAAVRQLLGYGDGWLPAKATWYGSPNGAGPDDNGMYALLCCCPVNKLVCGFACMPSEQQCRA